MTPNLPAGWAPRTDVLGAPWAAVDPAIQEAAQQLAVAELWALSGRQFGVWAVELAPYIAPRRPNYYGDSYYGVPYYLFNASAGAVSGGYGIAGPTVAFQLPRPVVSVQAVSLDGEELVEGTDYAVDPGGQLIWLRSVDQGGWPVGQNVYAHPPRWIVSYTRGVPVPIDGQLAAGRYALAIAQGLEAKGIDKVPGRARDYSRNNVNVQLAAPEELSNAGLTGVPLVDAWLRVVNPHKLAAAATLWSPEIGRHRVLNRVGATVPDTTAPDSGPEWAASDPSAVTSP